MQDEQRIEGGLQHAQHDRHVFRLAARHDGVDGHLLDRAGREVGRDLAYDFVRLALGAAQHAQDAFVGRRHDGQPVAPATLEAGFDRIVPFADRHRARLEARVAVARDQGLLHAGLDAFRSAARLPGRQPVARRRRAGEARPFGAIPAHRPLDLAAVLQADQRRHGLDVQAERPFEIVIVDHPPDAGGKRRIVLDDHGERAGTIETLHHRFDQHAGRTVALGDDDEAVARQEAGSQTIRH